MGRKVRVLVVDDSALVREMLSAMLETDPDIEVVGTAADAQLARRKIVQLSPDVLTLDIEMPGMDGLTFLDKIMRLRPMPVVMVSSHTQDGAEATLRALELGAIAIVAKPTSDVAGRLEDKQAELITKVKEAAQARVRANSDRRPDKPEARPRGRGASLIAIGASTGGVEAISGILAAMPADMPPLLIVQHMPPGFTTSFAARLDRGSALTVVEAADGMRLEPGQGYVAPGNRHLRVARLGTGLVCRLDDGPPMSGHRPSVDALFQSVAEVVGERAIGVILTGMGRDGALGLAQMRHAGAYTIGQDPESCVVPGMPAAAAALDALARQVPLDEIAGEIVRGDPATRGASP